MNNKLRSNNGFLNGGNLLLPQSKIAKSEFPSVCTAQRNRFNVCDSQRIFVQIFTHDASGHSNLSIVVFATFLPIISLSMLIS